MPDSVHRERRVELICRLIEDSKMPRNQLAEASGLTNTFIKDLEQGKITNVDRKKLLRLAITLNLDLGMIDETLRVFDRANLSTDDIATFIESAHKRKAISAIFPCKNFYSYELSVFAMELLPGDQNIVNDRPLVCLREPGHRVYSDRFLVDSHPLYADLLEAIGRARREQFERNLETHKITLYLCQECMGDYLVVNDCQEKKWRKQHIRNLLDVMHRFDNLSVKIIGTCSYMLFSLNQPIDERHAQLTFCAKPGHHIPGERPGRIAGFSTRNAVMMKTFEDEMESIRTHVIPELSERRTVMDYLERMVD